LGNKKKRMADFLLSCSGMRDFHSGRFVLSFIVLPSHNQVRYQTYERSTSTTTRNGSIITK
jgi:hypothetical protein